MIRQITVDELDILTCLGEQFTSSVPALSGFKADHTKTVWRALLTSGAGVIFALFDETGAPIGMLGAAKHPNILTGELTAGELFWFVDPANRGKGLLLLDAYEKWAQEQGCKSWSIVHLLDSMPEKLQKLYTRRGYKAIEINYRKEA
jgi:GNAT superfamily N-acetyltransferase